LEGLVFCGKGAANQNSYSLTGTGLTKHASEIRFALRRKTLERRMMTRDDLQSLLLRNLPEVDHRGEVVDEVGPDSVRLRMPVLDTYLSHDLPPGSGKNVLSGPIEMGFAETAMYACVHAVYGPMVSASTVSFTGMFLRAAGSGDLTAKATLLRRGRSTAFVEALLFPAEATEPCAQFTATYAIRAL
jgi:acyl-coenzyme A thioesterase PaaI-like protein